MPNWISVNIEVDNKVTGSQRKQLAIDVFSAVKKNFGKNLRGNVHISHKATEGVLAENFIFPTIK